ncbi:junctional sarcoplasmic reticulum protein 1-like [Seriola lalandi dorsalis]|uniref:junctional sarcoplasmic reticulum protein 1-like n=1 Tax=Seriola lalandi dorsalis TaxID=1841481 RepID=UPI000C6FB92F|nr:junctional sarcoplasmic reticulum protein 1-like [Seriola lalandi dorsalis]
MAYNLPQPVAFSSSRHCPGITCAWLSDSLEHDSAAISAKEQRASVTKVPRRCPGDPKCGGREGMEESYETFEEELGPPRADPPPQKPVRQIHRPEMYAPRKIREEMAPVSKQPRSELKTLPREPSFPRTTSLHKALSIQNLTQIETPWENVTLNRCLFVAITILVLTSGFQRLHETLRGQGTVEEEEVGLTVRRSGTLRHRGQPPEPETSLWEVMFWWLPDFDDEEDEEDEEDDGEVRRGMSKKGAMARTSRGLRNKPLPDKKLMKQRDGKLKDRRAQKTRDEETKDKKDRDKKKDVEEAVSEEDEDDGETAPKKSRKLEEKKEKKKSQKG